MIRIALIGCKNAVADYGQVAAFLHDFHPIAHVDPEGSQGNPARCAVELSLLDAFGRRFGRSIHAGFY